MDRDMAAHPMPPAARLTADEYLARVQRTHEFSELVRGEVRPVSPAGLPHNRIALNALLALDRHVRAHGLGRCFTDNAGFRLPIPRAEGDTVRSPDVAFVSFARMEDLPTGYAGVAPELVVEVLSPDDSARELDERLDDYFAAGTRLVWVVDPERRTVAVHSDAGPTRRLREADALDGADVVPGFTLPVRELFAGL